MIKFTLKKRILLFIIFIILALLFVAGVIIFPTVKSINNLKREIGAIESDLEQRYQNSQKLRRTLRELSDIKTQTEQLKDVTILKGEELKVITELESLASKYNIDQVINVSLQQVSKADLGKYPTAEYYSFSFLDNGKFSDLVSYLKEIEQLPYYIVIKNINFENRQNNAKENSLITLSFNGLVYVKPEIQK